MIPEIIYLGFLHREKDKEKTTPIRMSNAGKCQRAIAYQLHGFEKKPLPPRALMVFRLGDAIESEIKDLLGRYSPPEWEITYPKEDFFIEVEGNQIIGHVDGIITVDGVAKILEIKSTNTKNFHKLEKTLDVSYEYKCQATAYMKALGLKSTLFVFYNKDTSHLLEIEYKYDESIWELVKRRFENVIKSKKEELPDREYGWNQKGALDWHCSYCSMISECRPEAILEIVNGKPVYKKATAGSKETEFPECDTFLV